MPRILASLSSLCSLPLNAGWLCPSVRSAAGLPLAAARPGAVPPADAPPRAAAPSRPVSPAAGATTSVPRTREEADERYEWWHFLL